MKSRPIGTDQNILASHHNDRRDDARGGGFLLAHQQLGAIALPTNPANTHTLTLTINGTAIVITFVSAIGSTANNVLIGASAAATALNLVNFLRRPDLTSATQVAASAGNQTLLQYCGYALPGSSTSIVPFSLNKNVNGISGALTSFTASTTVTGGSWTAQTMQLYVEDGTYYIGGTRYLFTGGSTPTVTAPSSHPRIDVLTINSSGTLAWTTGTESTSPSAPAYPTGVVPICELYNVVSETALYDNENQQSGEGYIYNDVRPTISNPYGEYILAPSSPAQGDLLYFNGSSWVTLAPGTSGYVLETQGSGANPQWTIPVSGTLGAGIYDPTSGNILIVDCGAANTTSSTYTQVHQFTCPASLPSGTYTIITDGYVASGSATGDFLVYKNGIAVGTTHSSSSTSPVSFTDSLSLAAGDEVQLYIKNTGGGYNVSVTHFGVAGIYIPTPYAFTVNS
jgi:hypothetical protein